MEQLGSNAPAADFYVAGAPDERSAYLELLGTGELSRRAEALEARLGRCDLCPRACGVDRNRGKVGYCGVGNLPKVAAINLHCWEEPPISGTRGSGTIFFSGCTLKCIFCQNYPISQLGVGREVSIEDLAFGMLELQNKGAHNINLVTPTHQIAAIIRALVPAAHRGLRIPLVYNSNGYESLETLRLLDGVIDVYLPDIKYSEPETAKKYSGAADYVRFNREALVEMWRQAGPIRTDAEGIALKGMLVRHLVLPENLAGSGECFSFLSRRIGSKVWVSLMNQYFPAYKGPSTPPLDRKTMRKEYEAAFSAMTELGILNGFVQAAS
ncbi:MAG: radical SAM protein [Syntrophobacteraceae bacterium]|jgi:putative pyruvate formate lyase activating enzyme